MRRFTQKLSWPMKPKAGGMAVTAPPREKRRRELMDVIFDGLVSVTAWLWAHEQDAHRRFDWWLDNGGVFSPTGQRITNWFSAAYAVGLIAVVIYAIVRR